MENLSKKQIVLVGIVVVIFCSVIGYYIYSKLVEQDGENFDSESNISVIQKKETTEEEIEKIVVHIAGRVKNPGIVKIEEGARIADIIEAAGGLTEEADITNINLAYIIEDGQKIVIPKKGEEQGNETEEYITKESGDTVIQDEKNIKIGGKSMININKANQEELQQLQGIGEATALKIIEYRKQNGNFNTIEDIKNVQGIGDAKFESIKESITVK